MSHLFAASSHNFGIMGGKLTFAATRTNVEFADKTAYPHLPLNVRSQPKAAIHLLETEHGIC